MQVFRFVVFVVVFLGLIALGHRYLWLRLVHDTQLPKSWRRLAGLLLVGMGLLFAYRFLLARRLGDTSTWLALVTYTWLGFLAVSVPLLLVMDLPRWLGSVLRRVRSIRSTDSAATSTEEASARATDGASEALTAAAAADAVSVEPAEDMTARTTGNSEVPEERRLFLGRAAAGVASLGATGLVGVGMHNALGDVELKRVSVKMPRLPRALDGFRLVQLSDVHIGPLLDGRFLERVVETVNRERPDAVVITGDLVDGSPQQLGSAVARLSKIKARYGVYFVTGNHEYYSGAPRWLRFLDKLGIRCLQNARVRLGDRHPQGASFDLAGVCDESAGRFVPSHRQDLAAALRGRDRERELVLLAHRPNIIETAADFGVGLQLSGHTHGGQFFPITLLSPLVHPFNQGLYRHRQSHIYVSPGTGFWGPPMRTMTASEVTSIQLVAG